MPARSHGHRAGGQKSPTYVVWENMIQRCYNPNRKCYDDYGGAGIRVYFEWVGVGGFAAFLEDMGVRPDGYQLSRKDHNDGYSPWNCEWIPAAENVSERNYRNLSHAANAIRARGPDGRIQTLTKSQWAEEIGITYKSLQKRLQRGWGKLAYSTPRGERRAQRAV